MRASTKDDRQMVGFFRQQRGNIDARATLAASILPARINRDRPRVLMETNAGASRGERASGSRAVDTVSPSIQERPTVATPHGLAPAAQDSGFQRNGRCVAGLSARSTGQGLGPARRRGGACLATAAPPVNWYIQTACAPINPFLSHLRMCEGRLVQQLRRGLCRAFSLRVRGGPMVLHRRNAAPFIALFISYMNCRKPVAPIVADPWSSKSCAYKSVHANSRQPTMARTSSRVLNSVPPTNDGNLDAHSRVLPSVAP